MCWGVYESNIIVSSCFFEGALSPRQVLLLISASRPKWTRDRRTKGYVGSSQIDLQIFAV